MNAALSVQEIEADYLRRASEAAQRHGCAFWVCRSWGDVAFVFLRQHDGLVRSTAIGVVAPGWARDSAGTTLSPHDLVLKLRKYGQRRGRPKPSEKESGPMNQDPDLPQSVALGKRAAVSLVVRDCRMLVVRSLRYGGWTMPGGSVNERETCGQAQARELLEETGLQTESATLVYVAHVDPPKHPERASDVYVYRVVAQGQPSSCEPGCDVSWMTKEQFLEECPFRAFYARMFEVVS